MVNGGKQRTDRHPPRFRIVAAGTATILALAGGAAALAATILRQPHDWVHAGRVPILPATSLIAAGILLAVCLVRLAGHPIRTMRNLIRWGNRDHPLPELLEIGLFLSTATLILLDGTLPLMDESTLFRAGVFTMITGLAVLPPILMSRNRLRTFTGRLGGFLLGLVAALLLAEGGLRLLVKGSVYHPALDLRPNLRLEVHTDTPGISPEAVFTTNSLGLRGEEPTEDRENWSTLLTVGGSTTNCFYLDDSRTWPHLLQEELREARGRVWVGNGGLEGHSTRGHMLFMREVVPAIRPDLVIILCGTNDLGISLKPHLLQGQPQEEAGFGDRVYAGPSS